jgi:hypothetical protein
MTQHTIKHFLLSCLLTTGIFTVGNSKAIAQTGASSRPSDYPSSPNPYARGLWTATAYGGFAVQPGGGYREQLGYGTVGLGYYLFDNISLNAELTGLHASQPGEDVVASGGDLLLRNHLYNGRNWSLFNDFALGILEGDHRIPPPGTDFNFTIQTGIGATVDLWQNTQLLTGIRYLHVSNAHQEGPLRNPSINAVSAYAGLLFKF